MRSCAGGIAGLGTVLVIVMPRFDGDGAAGELSILADVRRDRRREVCSREDGAEGQQAHREAEALGRRHVL